MKENISRRLYALRTFMSDRKLAAFIIPSTDPHCGEYVPEHWETRKWITGFTGSAGTAVITLDKAGLWTDSRYFLQAAEQLKESGITLFKEKQPDTPSIAEWLRLTLKKGDRIGIDGTVNSIAKVEELQQCIQSNELQIIASDDPFSLIWEDRPVIPRNPVFIHSLQYAGVSCTEKIKQIRLFLRKEAADSILLSALDEIAWTLNLRGNDVHCNPVFISYLLITGTNSTLFIYKEKITPEIRDYLAACNVEIAPYDSINDALLRHSGERIIMPPSTNYALYLTASSASHIKRMQSPVALMKAIKNKTEINGFRQAMKRDGIAMVKFLKWLKESVGKTAVTEMGIDRKLLELRSKQPLFRGISFDTIAGYGAHGAIVHYEATPETDAALADSGFLLLDSGAQYEDGTTDITRTIALGKLTQEQKRDYTLVLKGFIALSRIEFPHGTCGTQLDVLARQYMWAEGINYGHGTGHGVGHFLNVHEGPHQIRMNYMETPLLPGMTVTNEPGIYKDSRYGIRTENTMLVVFSRKTEFGQFYRFEPLTICPIDKTAVIPEMLSAEEIVWLDTYHSNVYEQLAPFLSPDEQEWLRHATLPLSDSNN